MTYAQIAKRKSVREGYLDRLLGMGEITREEADAIAQRRRNHLENELSQAHEEPPSRMRQTHGGYIGGPDESAPEVNTAVPKDVCRCLLEQLSTLPADFHPHPRIKKILAQRMQMAQDKAAPDWAAGEALAFATLTTEGVPIRMSGQDSERGTFSHRHAVLHTSKTATNLCRFIICRPTNRACEFTIRRSLKSACWALNTATRSMLWADW